MLVELTFIPLGVGESLSDELAEVIDMIDASGLHYCLTPSGTCIEGEWDEVMALIKRCHTHLRQHSSHLFTTISIEDEAGAEGKLVNNVTSVAVRAQRAIRVSALENAQRYGDYGGQHHELEHR